MVNTYYLFVGDLNSSVVVTGLPATVKQLSIKQFLAPVKPKVMRVVHNTDASASLVTFNRKPDQKQVLKRNGDYFGGFKVCAMLLLINDVCIH